MQAIILCSGNCNFWRVYA